MGRKVDQSVVNAMLKKLSSLFKGGQSAAKQQFLEQNHIQWNAEEGYIVDGIILNRELAERLVYLSNRRINTFDDLAALYLASMLINEKIDLEIAQQQLNQRIGNTEENLRHFQSILKRLGEYYRQFLREK